ncbi:MAG: VWA domain-containing protein [Pirellulales bacterium]
MSWSQPVSPSSVVPGLLQPRPVAVPQAAVGKSATPVNALPHRGPWFSRWEASRGGVASAVLHAVSLILLGLTSAAPDGNTSAPVIVAEQVSPQDELGDLAWEDSPAATLERLDLAYSAALQSDDAAQPAEFDLSPEIDSQVGHESLLPELSELTREAGDGQGKGAGGTGNAGGDGHGQAANGKSASFFGIQATGERFVFVVDLSGSMEGHRFSRAKRELRQSLNKLAAGQSYYIIFFNTAAFPMPAGDLVAANSSNRRKTNRWISQLQSGGFTNPASALRLAVELDPDAIFFLTDGEFDPEIVDMVEPASTSASLPIHTIAFQSQAGEGLMQEIARRTHGTYRYVK